MWWIKKIRQADLIKKFLKDNQTFKIQKTVVIYLFISIYLWLLFLKIPLGCCHKRILGLFISVIAYPLHALTFSFSSIAFPLCTFALCPFPHFSAPIVSTIHIYTLPVISLSAILSMRSNYFRVLCLTPSTIPHLIPSSYLKYISVVQHPFIMFITIVNN